MNRHCRCRSASIPVALALSFALVSCAGSASPPAQSGPADSSTASASPTSAPPGTGASTAPASPSSAAPTASGSTTAALSTFSGTWEDVQYAFDYPADWDVQGPAPGSGEVTVIGPDGTSLASLTILIAWGAECPCVERPVVHLGDVPGDKPLSKSGPFVARALAMDLTGFPQDRAAAENVWPDNVRLGTSLNMNTGPAPTVLMPRLLHGLGLVDTGVVASNGITHRTIIFVASRDFGTLQEAEAYAASDEHRKIQEMIASFREGTA